MRIKNITPNTISVDVLGDYREIRSGWGLTEQEVRGKDVLLLIAFKLQGQIEIYDDNDQIMEFVNCPLCGNVVKIAPAPKVLPTTAVIEKKIKQPVKAEIKIKQVKAEKSRVKKSKK